MNLSLSKVYHFALHHFYIQKVIFLNKNLTISKSGVGWYFQKIIHFWE